MKNKVIVNPQDPNRRQDIPKKHPCHDWSIAGMGIGWGTSSNNIIEILTIKNHGKDQ